MIDFVPVIRFQILARTETGGGPEGPPFYFAREEEVEMAKPFLTYEQQINKLINEKHLQISDRTHAKEILKDIGYFALIGGYKTPFINPMTRIYQNNASFDDVLALYQFDLSLRELVFKYLCLVERKIRQLVSYAFCSKHGELQSAYLNSNNYNNNQKNASDIARLIQLLDYHANHNTEHKYVLHQRTVYNNVPLWVLVNTLTYGQISKFYALLPFQMQSDISKEFPKVNERELEQYLKILTLFRNVCAHNERLYSFRIQIDFPDTVLHNKLGITKKGNQYTLGKRDLFGLVIAFRYLLPKQDFLEFKRSLIRILSRYTKSSHQINKNELLNTMGFPSNWEHITRYQV